MRTGKNTAKYLLLTPGPVKVANNVQQATIKNDICHREPDFEILLQSIEKKLLALVNIKNTDDYRGVVITGSGTAANESILSSVVGNKNILILSNGEFGERLFSTSSIYNKNTFILKFPWGEIFDHVMIETYLKEHDIDVIAMVHHETSSGMLNSLEIVGKLAKINKAIFIVDCVSSVGAEIIDMKKDNISFCSGSSGKAIASYPGLSFVIGETRAFDALKNNPVKTGYLNLYKFYQMITTVSQTPNTPAVQLFYALEQALINILKKGSFNHHACLAKKAHFLRHGLLALGLTFLIKKRNMSSILTSIHCPRNINPAQLHQALRESEIIIYEGKGCFKNDIFQVGNIGELSFDDLEYFLCTLRVILQDIKLPTPHNETVPSNQRTSLLPVQTSIASSIVSRW